MLSPSSYVSLPGSVLPKFAEARRLAPCAPEKRIRVLLVLRFAREDPLVAAQAEELSLLPPGSRAYAARGDFAPVGEAREPIERFARTFDLRVGWPPDCGGLIVWLEGRVERLNAAFRVELHDYYSPAGDFRGFEGALSLPRDLGRVVRGVFGLAGRARPRLPEAKERPRPTPQDLPGPLPGNAPQQIARCYNFPEELRGAGRTIAIIEELYGEQPDPASGASPVRQLLAALVPEAAVLPFDPAERPVDDWPAAVVFALVAAVLGPRESDVLLIDLGDSEFAWTGDELNFVSLLLGVAACLGLSVCAPAGDFGATGFDPSRAAFAANVHFPASSPYVLACGGTELGFRGQRERSLAHEAVWNELGRSEKPRATGGGVSRVFAVPVYQNCGVKIVADPPVAAGRALPDVAANASGRSGYRLLRAGEWEEQVGGTALAAALWAALLLLVGEGLGARLGWVQPLLYRFQIKDRAGVCRRVYFPESENCNGPLNRRYPAKFCATEEQPFSACTGLGSPDGRRLLEAFRALADSD